MPVEFTKDATASTADVYTAILASGETFGAVEPIGLAAVAGSVSFAGTFASAIALEQSNDGTNWFPVLDTNGGTIETSAAGIFDFTCSARYLRPTNVIDVTAVFVLRGDK